METLYDCYLTRMTPLEKRMDMTGKQSDLLLRLARQNEARLPLKFQTASPLGNHDKWQQFQVPDNASLVPGSNRGSALKYQKTSIPGSPETTSPMLASERHMPEFVQIQDLPLQNVDAFKFLTYKRSFPSKKDRASTVSTDLPTFCTIIGVINVHISHFELRATLSLYMWDGQHKWPA